MAKHRILVTGSNGLLGQKLLVLLSGKEEVELLATSLGVNRVTSVRGLNYEPLDITSYQEVDEICTNFSPTAIINTAALTQVDDCEVEIDKCKKLNVEAVANLLKVSKKIGCKLVQLSTDFVFDGEKGNYSEMDMPNPLGVYAQSKYDSEALLSSSGYKNWTIARTIILYGVTEGLGRSNLVLWALQALKEGKKINVVDDQFRAPTLAEDLAEGCWLMVKNDAKGIYHLSGPKTFSIIELVKQVAQFFKLDDSLINSISSKTLNQAAHRPPKTGFDISKARKDLGYHPKSFLEGLAVVERQLDALLEKDY